MSPERNIALPVEILDHIFSFLRTDIPTLTVCMSSSPSFQAIGEKHLWHHYTLHNCHDITPQKQPSGTPAQLSKILTDAPHLAAYIRSLEITIAAPSILQWFMTRSLNVDEMAELLPLLTHLERVSLAGRWISWDKLSQSFQAAVVRALGLPSVEEVAIEGMERFPLALFNRCSALKRISFTACNFVLDLDCEMESLQTGTRPSLEALSIREIHTWLRAVVDWLCSNESAPDITNLRFLSIAVDAVSQLSCVADLLHTCSNSLRELKLTPSQGVNLQYDLNTNHGIIPLEYITPPPLNLSQMRCLRFLTIGGEIWTSDGFWVSSDGQDTLEKSTYSTPFAWMCRLLESPPPNLTYLTLDILFKVVYPSNLKWICWAELARALSSPHLGSLRCVELVLSFQATGNVSRVAEVALGIFRSDAYLSDLIRKGLLVVRSRTKKDEVSVRL